MKHLLKVLIIALTTKWASCSVDGISYMDPLNFRPHNILPKGEDPCNPLYWYPRNIPEYCNFNKATPKCAEKIPLPPLPMPIPVPMPMPQPIPMPMPQPIPMPMPQPFPMPPPEPMPIPCGSPQIMPMPAPLPFMPPPLPYGIPIQPTHPMLPVGGFPYPGHPPVPPMFPPQYGMEHRAGMVPGLPGLVSPDGGINILPFSDAYSELLEKHKQKIIRKKMQKLLAKYNYPKRGHRKSRRNHRRQMGRNSWEDDYNCNDN